MLGLRQDTNRRENVHQLSWSCNESQLFSNLSEPLATNLAVGGYMGGLHIYNLLDLIRGSHQDTHPMFKADFAHDSPLTSLSWHPAKMNFLASASRGEE